eukprot:gene7921-9304_t
MTTFISGGYYVTMDLTTGQQLQNFVITGATSGISVSSLLQCSGDDYTVLTEGTNQNYLNISTFNSAANTMTTLAQFECQFPPNALLSFQYNSIDIQSELAFSTYCTGDGLSSLIVFNLKNQSVEMVTFAGSACSLYTIGSYDNSTQTYYAIGDLYGFKLSHLSFSVYSMSTGHITQVDIPYKMDDSANLQQVFVYESILYACIFQSSFTEVIAIDFATQSSK